MLTQAAPSDWSGASAGLALLASATSNGSTALEVAQRWGNSAFTKLLITKKREFDMQMRVRYACKL
jgi:CelD/BcsL family acetyltransferase involved in cellulose biosynthesis